jgi:hypothetical protein
LILTIEMWDTLDEIGVQGRVVSLILAEGILEERLKRLMQELGNAINESLSDSDRIATAISEIKRSGYDVVLVLEATIGFNKAENGEETDEADAVESDSDEITADGEFEATSKVKWTLQDQKFLRALKISVDDEPR